MHLRIFEKNEIVMALLVEETPKRKKKIPSHLIKEELDGVPYYYKGFREVLANKKTFEEIMGSSILQTLILDAIQRFLYGVLSADYVIASNEAGLHLKKNDNIANDIAIYLREEITDKLSKKYYDFPAKLVIEVDVDVEADTEKSEELKYVLTKIRKMLDFGVEKVIWILSENRKIIVATPHEDWVFKDWNADIPLFDSLVLNLEVLLKENRIL